MPRSVRKPAATRRTAPPRPCSSASRNPQRRIEAWRLLDSVRRRFVDDVPATGQEKCFHAFNLRVHDVVLDAHLQVLIRHASKMEEGGRELLPWFLSAPAATVWKIKAEKKIKFFIWILLQNRLWTADRLQARNWDHNDLCVGCDQVLESAHHLVLDCPFAKEIWFKTNPLYPLAAQAALDATSISSWWNKVAKLKKKGHQVDECTAAVYIAWNIWLERNRRIFKDTAQSTTDVLVRVRDDISLLSEAWE